MVDLSVIAATLFSGGNEFRSFSGTDATGSSAAPVDLGAFTIRASDDGWQALNTGEWGPVNDSHRERLLATHRVAAHTGNPTCEGWFTRNNVLSIFVFVSVLAIDFAIPLEPFLLDSFGQLPHFC
jgi:hypothetical protein